MPPELSRNGNAGPPGATAQNTSRPPNPAGFGHYPETAVRARRSWTPAEDAILHQNYVRHGLDATLDALHANGHHRNRSSTRNRAYRLRLTPTHPPPSSTPLGGNGGTPRTWALHALAESRPRNASEYDRRKRAILEANGGR